METLAEQSKNIVSVIPKEIIKNTVNGEFIEADERKNDREFSSDTEEMRTESVPETNEEHNSETLRIPLDGAEVGYLKRKLLVLDLNGLLANFVYPLPNDHKADAIFHGCGMFMRPFCLEFLKFCFENFEVAIWSTGSKKCVKHFVDFLKGNMKNKFLFYWDESHSTITSFNTFESKHKFLKLKDLRKIWDKQHPDLPWEKGYYNESNTLLLDDSPYKALLNPPYTSVFPHKFRYQNSNDNSLGVGGDLREYIGGLAKAENMAKYVEEHPFGQEPITKTSQSWNYYQHVLATISMSQPQHKMPHPT